MITKDSRGTPVVELQRMLRTISTIDKTIPLINPDGIYGPETENAVRVFQSQKGLHVTGNTDFETWKAIKKAAADAKYKVQPGVYLRVFPSPDYVVRRGEKSPVSLIIQIIIDGISPAYDGLEGIIITGIFDEQTENKVKIFQRYHRLEPTGEVDKRTRDELARSYNNFANNPVYIS